MPKGPADAPSGPAPPQLSLPKGGGAIRGLDESFTTNAVTGAGEFSVPIPTSTGRSGMQPQLPLSYSSSQGNGPFGWGWSVALPAITRKTNKGLPQYEDWANSDIFLLTGAEDLTPLLALDQGKWVLQSQVRALYQLQYQVTQYRPRVEAGFARIERWANLTDATDVFWRTISRTNTTNWYGLSAADRVADPTDPTRIFSWLISQCYDDKGNAMAYAYKAEDSQGVDLGACNERNRTDLTRSAQRYTKTISYGNRTPYFPDLSAAAATPLPTDWCFTVVFDYGEHDPVAPTIAETQKWICRADPFSTYRPTFELRTYRLCRRVLSFHNFPTETVGANSLVRSTNLAHAVPPTADPTQPFYSYLLTVSQTGYANGGATAASASMPPVAFTYSQAVIDETVRDVDPRSVANLPVGIDGGAYRWVDLDGEGLAGILTEQGGGWYYKANLSAANVSGVGAAAIVTPAFAGVECVSALPSLADLAGGRQQLLPLSGDGQMSLTQFGGPVPGYFERTAAGGWQDFQPFVSLPVTDWRDPNLRFVDLTGDGFADLLISGDDALIWCESLSTEGFGPAKREPIVWDEEQGPKLVFSDGTETIFLADMTGDGLTDLVRVRMGEVCYWPNLGYGRFGTKVTLDGVPVFDRPDQFDARRIRLADIDGSGAADILYFTVGAVRVWFNQSGNALAQMRSLNQFPGVDTASRAQVLDLLGVGTACLVWSSPLPGAAQASLRYIDLMGGQKPHLLTGVVNNLGAETVIAYAPSTRFYVADKLAGTPWITRLPFPVQVVTQIETRDRIGRNRFLTSYAYHHGYYDGVEREFRGFARVDQWDTGELTVLGAANVDADAATPPANENAASDVPPVLTKTWYHTGFYFDGGPISAALKHEYYQEGTPAAPAAMALLLDDTPLPDSVMLPDGSHIAYALSPEELRQACRALRGSMLRREVYALDGSAAQSLPYASKEQNFTVEVLQPCGPNPYAAFLPHARESLDITYERSLFRVNGLTLVDPSAPPAPGDVMAADPRVTHAVTLATDAYGNVLQSVSIGYGRRFTDPGLSAIDQTSQATMLCTCAINSFTNAITTVDANRTPLPAQADTYQLLQLAPTVTTPGETHLIDFASLAGQVATASAHDIPFEDDPPTGLIAGVPYRRLVGRTRTFYRPDDLGTSAGSAGALLALGTLESLALPGQTYRLALTPGLIPLIYTRGGTALLPSPGTVLTSTASDGGGYVDLDGDGSAWSPTARIYYAATAVTPAQESASAQAHFFLPHRYVDPFGAAAVVAYDDPHDLLPVSVTDAMGNVASVANDYRVLAPSLLTDANGNQTAAQFDAMGLMVGTAVMGKPSQVLGDSFATFNADPSQAQIDAFFNAADPHTVAGALLGTATTCIVYDLQRYLETSQANPTDDTTWQPTYTATLSREIHDSDLAEGATSPIQITFSYSDGFGREIQKKVEAEPAPGGTGGASPRWIGDGWTVLNNKGKPVRKYEPFFSALATEGHHFEFAVLNGVSPILCYDPLDRVVATIHANQTYEKVVFDPWTQTRWDVNDTVMQDDPAVDGDVGGYLARLPPADLVPTWRTQRIGGALGSDEQTAAVNTAAHANTPTVIHLDTMARTVLTIADNAAFGSYPTRVQYDVQGRQRAITDPLGRTTVTFDYDMLGTRLRQTSMEAGQRWMLNDAVGKTIRAWDSRGHNRRSVYDALRRPGSLFVLGTDPVNSDPRTLAGEICYETKVYGEGQPNDQALNLRSRVFQHRDPTGLTQNSAQNPATQQTEAFDFKGNLLRTTRQFVAAVNTLTDWSGAAPAVGPAWTTAATFDALNRVTTATTSDGAVTARTYNARNLLQAVGVTLSGAAAATGFVTEIDYDAKGQRLAVTYGNAQTNTVYAYDPLTFRLTSLTTTRPVAPAGQQTVQALSYVYDPVGNITHIQDDADLQDTIFFRNRRVDPSADYTYDAIYRLITAGGREQLGLAGATPLAPAPTSYNDSPRTGLLSPGDGQAMGTYLESYSYDWVGNFTTLVHRGADPANPGWTRSYAYNEPSLIDAIQVSNRLSNTSLSGSQTALEPYTYDPHGSLGSMPQLQVMQWDFLDQLLMTRRQAVNSADADGTLHQGERTYYVYGADGQRARKSTLSSTGVLTRQRWYFGGGWELYQEYNTQGVVTLERRMLSVMDDARRVALIDTTTVDASASSGSLPTVATRYQYGNHLGSACLELDETAAVVTYEEYYPFGGTSYQAGRSVTEVSLKRYRFAGKERDEETGLSFHGARYYATWLGRWTACDPAGYADGNNLYLYCHDNPVVLSDPRGTQAAPNAQGADPDIHYHPPPTLEERAATALGDYHLTLTPLPPPDFSFHIDVTDPLKLAVPPPATSQFDPTSPDLSPPDASGPDKGVKKPDDKKPPTGPEFRFHVIQLIADRLNKPWIGHDLAFGVGVVTPFRRGTLSVGFGVLSGDSGTDIPGFATPDSPVTTQFTKTFPFVQITPNPYVDTCYYQNHGPYTTLAEAAPIQWYDPDPSLGIHLKYTTPTSKTQVGFTFGWSPGNVPLLGALPNYTPITQAAPHAAGDAASLGDLFLSKALNYNPQTDAGWWLGGRFYVNFWP